MCIRISMKTYFIRFSCEIYDLSRHELNDLCGKYHSRSHLDCAHSDVGLLSTQKSIQGVVKPRMTLPLVPRTSKSILGAFPGQNTQYLPQQMLHTGFKPRLRPGKHPSLCSLRHTESKATFSTVVLHLPVAHHSPLPPSSYQC